MHITEDPAHPLSWAMESGLMVADIIVNNVIIFPLTVTYWSATWKLLDIYVAPHDHLQSAMICLILGCFVSLLAYFLLPAVHGFILEQQHHNRWHCVVSRIIIYIFCWGTMLFWRGIWNCADTIIGKGILASLCATGIVTILLIVLRSFRNGTSSPFNIQMDSRPEFYLTYPRFRTNVSDLCLYSFDAIFTVFIINISSIVLWVGLWNIGDCILWPSNKLLSYIISGGIGYGLTIIILLIQKPIFVVASKLHEFHRFLGIAFEDVVQMVMVVVNLLLWRGAWGLMKDFVLVRPSGANTSDIVWACWLCHVVSIAALLVLQVGSALWVVGCAVDGELGGGKDILLHIEYISHWYKQRLAEQNTISVEQESQDNEQSRLLTAPSENVYT